MTAKEYLMQVRRARLELRHVSDNLEELRTQAEGIGAITYDKDAVQVSPADHMSEVVIRLVEQEQKYAERVIFLHRIIDTISRQIAAMPNPAHAEVLRLRYTVEWSETGMWTGIADRMGYTKGYAQHLHGEALKSFGERYKGKLISFYPS